MRATVPFAPFALLLGSLSAVAVLSLSACDQDYASSDDGRETFMGDTKQVPPSSAAPLPKPPPMAPPQMGAPPPPAPPQGDASTDAAPTGSASARPLPHPSGR
jgi:hypothetical protein